MLFHPLEKPVSDFAVVALNYIMPKFLHDVWSRASLRICADGGANRVNERYMNDKKHDFIFPDAVIGDLKSLDRKLWSELKNSGTEIIEIHNSYINDVEKALRFLDDMNVKKPVILLGAFGGKMDQSMSAIHSMLAHPELEVYCLDDNNFSTWIRPGKTEINASMKWTTEVCGLLPLHSPVKSISTQGLKWNLNGGSLSMGNFISTSNEIISSKIHISTSHPVFWTNQTAKNNKNGS